MRTKIYTAIVIVGVLLVLGSIFSDMSQATNTGQVCTGLSSGKIDVSGNVKTVYFTAPSGSLVSRYCVKAGSINNENGPVYVDVDPPTKSVTISYPNGKDISHYSVEYVPDTTTTTTTSTTTTIPTTTSTVPSTTTTSTTTIPTTTSSTTTSTVPTTTSSTVTTSTTTIPSTTTVTTIPTTTLPSTTTVPSETTTTMQPAEVSDQAAVLVRPAELAATGRASASMFLTGIFLIIIGYVAILCERRKGKKLNEDNTDKRGSTDKS